MKIAAFTGLSCSGKSSVCLRLSTLLNARLVSERHIIKGLSNERGYRRIREWLFTEGTNAILNPARARTLEALVDCQSEFVLLDGVYDREMVNFLSMRLPSTQLLVINIQASEKIRLFRMRARHDLQIEDAIFDLRMIDLFKNLAGVRDVMDRSHRTVVNEGELGSTISLVHDHLLTWGSAK